MVFCDATLLLLKPRSFAQSFFVLRCACAPTATRSYLTIVCVLFLVLFLPFFYLFGDVAFYEYSCTIATYCLYEEDVVRFHLPDSVFLPCDHGLDF